MEAVEAVEAAEAAVGMMVLLHAAILFPEIKATHYQLLMIDIKKKKFPFPPPPFPPILLARSIKIFIHFFG